jgi:hypothetical protein
VRLGDMLASVYPLSKAARYRFFSQPAFPASLSSVQISGNDGASRRVQRKGSGHEYPGAASP